MRDIIYNLSNGIQVPLEQVYEFIKFVWETDNPDKEYKRYITDQVFAIGYGQNLITNCYNKVFSNPAKYGFSIMTLTDRGNLIKTYVKSN